MRQRKYKKYATSCDVLYYPEKEKMNIIDPTEKRVLNLGSGGTI